MMIFLLIFISLNYLILLKKNSFSLIKSIAENASSNHV